MPAGSRPANGYSAWRLIAEELRSEIADGRLPATAKLPTEHELAERFGVNRHTVRQAVATLAGEGLVASRRGSGTFVTAQPVVVHRIGLRTRFSDSLGDLAARAGARVVGSTVEPAPAPVAERLGLAEDAPAVRLETVRTLEGRPLALATHWFDAARLPGVADDFARSGSITRALQAAGVNDYLRASTTITARHATAGEAALLELGAGAVVLVVEAVDGLADGTPLQYGVTLFSAARIALGIQATDPAAQR